MAKTRLMFAVPALVAAGVLGPLCCSAAASGRGGGSGDAGQIISLANEDNRAMEHLDHLVNDIGSRPVDSVNFLQACEWAQDEFSRFGLKNVHLEKCGEIKGDFSGQRARSRYKRLYRSAFGEGFTGDTVPIFNVVADIPGKELPNEYVIVGAHLDSAPQGPGATDNGAGVAAVMEAARMLAASEVKPRRTIRFILFGGEEAGLVGSNGYVESHPEIIPNVSAVYNMDHGANFISGLVATAPLVADMREIFRDVMTLDPKMPFEVKQVEYLPTADPNCCASMVQKIEGQEGMRRVVTQSGCGAKSACGADGGGDEQAGMIVKEVTADGDTVVMHMIIPGAPGAGKDIDLKNLKDLEALGVSVEELKGGDGQVRKIVAMGSSDHAPFLAAGIPAFWWNQVEDASNPYPAHTKEDDFDKVTPRHLEHSATVIALGALGTANLDHMLSREKLTASEGGTGGGEKAVKGRGCSPSCGDKKAKAKTVKV